MTPIFAPAGCLTPMPNFSPSALRWIDEALAESDRQSLRRRRGVRLGRQSAKIVLDGRVLIHFGSNDYLGLAADRRLTEAVEKSLSEQGWGAGASPLIAGYTELHRRMEERLARFEGTESVLAFPSGFAANSGSAAALVGAGDVVFADKKNHASLFDGCRLSRADVRVYSHNDFCELEKLLDRGGNYKKRLIVTDSLFSMDGDFAPLVELADLADRFDAMLFVDEAHATGVYGKHGRGLAESLGLEDRVAVRVGTMSKALGCVGGFVAGSHKLIDWLVQSARSYVFSTAMPAALCAAVIAALDIVEQEPQRRETLLVRATAFRESLKEQGWNVGASQSQIIPLIVGSPDRALELSKKLREQGFFVPAVRPPTVPEGESLLRISLTYSHDEEMLAALLAALKDSRAP